MFTRTPHSVQFYAISLVLILVLPLVAVTAALLIRSANLEKAELHARLLQVAAAVADDIDREIDRRIAVLETLATSTHLRSRRWQDFYDQSAAAMKTRSYIILRDVEGRPIVNTYVPFGEAPKSTSDPATIALIAKTKAPVVSNLFQSQVVKRPVVNVSIPVLDEGALAYVLSIAVLPEDIREILSGQKLPTSWIIAVWDRDDVLIARSIDRDGSVGMRFPRQIDDQARKSVAVREGLNLSGEPVLVAAAASRLSGWRVSVNIPKAMAEDTMWRTFRLFGVASILALGLGLVLSFKFAQELQSALDAVASAVGSLRDRTAKASNPKTKVVEANDVIDALGEAAASLASHEERQKILLGEVTHRTKNLLTVIQAMASRTFAKTDHLAKQTFMERLHALARAQDLLIQSD